jgi:hypothetical protein
MDFLTLIHLISSVTLTGAVIAGLACVTLCSGYESFARYKFCFFIDALIFLMIFVECASGGLLVNSHKLSFHTPWIDAAFLLLSIMSALVISSFIIKLKIKNNYLKAIKVSRVIYFLMLILIILISRDAIMKSTYFWPN